MEDLNKLTGGGSSGQIFPVDPLSFVQFGFKVPVEVEHPGIVFQHPVCFGALEFMIYTASCHTVHQDGIDPFVLVFR